MAGRAQWSRAPAGWVVRHPPRHRDLVRRGVVVSGFTSDLENTRRVRVIPGGMAMVLALDGQVRVGRVGSRAEEARRLRSCAAEMRLRALDLEPDARSEGLLVSIPPWIARGCRWWGQVEEDDALAGRLPHGRTGVDDIVAGLRHAEGWQERFELVVEALHLERGCDAERGDWPPELVHAWALLSRSAGTTPIAQVADEVGRSVRYLQQGFDDLLGLPPKSVARVFRLKRASHLLAAGRAIDDVAATCGYCDQPHLTRDFKSVMGLTPHRYLSTQHRGTLAPNDLF